MADSWAQLEGGRYLADLYQKDSIQAAFLQKVIDAVNKLGTTLGANPVGEVEPPPPVNHINIATSGEMMHVALIHNSAIKRGINYFLEVSPNDPNFTQPLVKPLGPSRASLPFTLPTNDASGQAIKYYVRAYSQYPGSKPSKVTTFGGANNPQSITMGGSTPMMLLQSTGSGTSTTDGQQGASGFGKFLVQNKPITPISVPVATPISSPIVATPVKSVGDGLVHGDTIWEGDPAFILLRDDFIGGTSTNPGELAWSRFGSTTLFQGNGASSFPTRAGVVHILPPASTTQCCGIALNAPTTTSNEIEQMYPLVDYPSWQTEWIFTFVRQPAINSIVSPFPLVKISMYVGLACWGGSGLISTTDARPANFVGLRFDCDTTAPTIGDTTMVFECVSNANGTSATRNNTQGNTFDTGMAPTENVDYKFMLRCLTRGQVQMRLLNSLGGDTGWQTLNVPKNSYSGGTSNDNHGITTYTASGMSTNFALATAGTILDITGWTGGTAGANFSVINNRFNTVAFDWFDGSFSYGTATTTNQTTAVVSFYPAYYFTCEFGNDTEASPSNNRAIQLDFFSFVWNPGVNPNNTIAANPSKVRYF